MSDVSQDAIARNLAAGGVSDAPKTQTELTHPFSGNIGGLRAGVGESHIHEQGRGCELLGVDLGYRGGELVLLVL